MLTKGNTSTSIHQANQSRISNISTGLNKTYTTTTTTTTTTKPLLSINIKSHHYNIRPKISTRIETAADNKSYEQRKLDVIERARNKIEPFDWYKAWYPLDFISNLDTEKPNKIKLLNKDFVIWKGKNGDWTALEDKCPHRFAPLSEGSIEDDGSIKCKYHGWQFDESGTCLNIPQAENEMSLYSAKRNKQSCAILYPVKEVANMLWVWPTKSEEDFGESELTKVPISPSLIRYLETAAEKGIQKGFTRILPCSYDILLENLADPTNFLNTTKNPFKSKLAIDKHIPKFKIKEPEDEYFGDRAVVSADQIQTSNVKSEIKYIAPCLILQNYMYENNVEEIGHSSYYAVPIAPGWSRVFVFGPYEDIEMTKKFKLSILNRLFPWHYHNQLNELFERNGVILRMQDERNYLELQDEEDASIWKKYYCPTSSDIFLIYLRKWIDGIGGKGPFPLQSNSFNLKNPFLENDLLDRYEYHSKKCVVCKKGMEFINNLSYYFKFIIAACAPAFIVSMRRVYDVSNWFRLVFMFIILVSSFMLYLVEWIYKPKFFNSKKSMFTN